MSRHRRGYASFKGVPIVAVKAGCKYLVNVDKLAEYLNTNTLEAVQEAQEEAHGIKPIPVKL